MEDITLLRNTALIQFRQRQVCVSHYCQRQFLEICPQNINSPENNTVELPEKKCETRILRNVCEAKQSYYSFIIYLCFRSFEKSAIAG